MRIAIRGFIEGALEFEEFLEGPLQAVDSVIPSIAEKHAERLKGARHMIELEFLDEPDPHERFFRFGSDPRAMVNPVECELGVIQ